MTESPVVVDLGRISGDFLVFGGAVSNLQALQSLLDYARSARIGPDRMIFTGDAVAYCGDPEAVVRLLDGKCHWLAGNCERQLAADADDCGCGFDEGSTCDRLAEEWFAFSRRNLSEWSRRRMDACPDVFIVETDIGRTAVIHGGLTDRSRFIWPSSGDEAFQEELEVIDDLCGHVDIVFAGHCGIAFQRQIGDRLWVNAGSIGMPPNDGRQDTRFVVVRDGRVVIVRLPYDSASAFERMEWLGVSKEYAQTLLSGIWPSQDVLPEELKLFPG